MALKDTEPTWKVTLAKTPPGCRDRAARLSAGCPFNRQKDMVVVALWWNTGKCQDAIHPWGGERKLGTSMTETST